MKPETKTAESEVLRNLTAELRGRLELEKQKVESLQYDLVRTNNEKYVANSTLGQSEALNSLRAEELKAAAAKTEFLEMAKATAVAEGSLIRQDLEAAQADAKERFDQSVASGADRDRAVAEGMRLREEFSAQSVAFEAKLNLLINESALSS